MRKKNKKNKHSFKKNEFISDWTPIGEKPAIIYNEEEMHNTLLVYMNNIYMSDQERQNIKRSLALHNCQYYEHPLSSHINRLYNISKNEL